MFVMKSVLIVRKRFSVWAVVEGPPSPAGCVVNCVRSDLSTVCESEDVFMMWWESEVGGFVCLRCRVFKFGMASVQDVGGGGVCMSELFLGEEKVGVLEEPHLLQIHAMLLLKRPLYICMNDPIQLT